MACGLGVHRGVPSSQDLSSIGIWSEDAWLSDPSGASGRTKMKTAIVNERALTKAMSVRDQARSGALQTRGRRTLSRLQSGCNCNAIDGISLATRYFAMQVPAASRQVESRRYELSALVKKSFSKKSWFNDLRQVLQHQHRGRSRLKLAQSM